MQSETLQESSTQTAIATKKRLYAKALDSLTSNSRVSLATSSSSASTKRPLTATEAFDEARERATKRLRQSTSSSSLVPLRVHPTAAAPKKETASASKHPPNYAPWSHEAFLARLKTFSSVSLWHPKPESINEVEWAKRGWSCVGINTVCCRGGCQRKVVVNLESIPKKANGDDLGNGVAAEEDEDEENEASFEQALAERYKSTIVNGHAESCLWRKGGCKDDIYHLHVVRPSVWQPELQKRVKSVLEIQGAIESVKIQSIERSDPSFLPPERLLKDLSADILGTSDYESPTQASAKALEIALHGWRGTKESGSELLHCDACFQRIGLWMYQPDYRPAHSTSEDASAEDDLTLNLLDFHREHCPWRNAVSQKASGSLSGLNACQILQRVISAYARDHRRRSDEQAGIISADAAHEDTGEVAEYSKEEVARQDKERESRLRKLKSLFSIKRRSTKSAPKTVAR